MRNLSLIALVIAAVLLLNGVFVVRQNETGVLFQLQKVVRSDIEPGLHFKIPFVQRSQVFDRRILTLDSQPEPYLTNEKKDVNVDFFAKWRITDAVAFYRATQGGSEERALNRLNPIIKEALRNLINQRNLRDVVASERTNLSEALVDVANAATGKLGIEIVDIRIKRLDLPDRVSNSVFERMRAERKEVANELRSQGTEAGEQIQATADRERRVLIAEAERDAQTLRGEGDAKAAEVYAAAYNRDPEFYGFNRSLEAYREAFMNGDDVMVLDPKSEFFRYFRDTSQNGAR
ncbi:MAG: protease modulator HflC [Lysobacteraceae bacterium]|nr:protease modulator HflC [Xanthomonadales bacterium]HPF72272.1 protease modulator HflC [Xanthomonadaceae bacterium]HRX98586.1 protease modulator HflC [Xanthomonadaceae bacterium]